MDFYEYQIPGTAPTGTWNLLIKNSIKATLDDGYFIGIIGEDYSANSDKEIDYALQISPSQVLPVIMSEQNSRMLLDCIQESSILNLSQTTSPVEKVKVIADKLIALDQRNNK